MYYKKRGGIINLFYKLNLIRTLVYNLKNLRDIKRKTILFYSKSRIASDMESHVYLYGKLFLGSPFISQFYYKSNWVTLINMKHGSSMHIFGNVTIGPNCKFVLDGGNLEINDRTYFSSDCKMVCKTKIIIGKSCNVSWGCTFMDNDGKSIDNIDSSLPILIEDNVWIGCNVTILKGVHIEEGCIVAANSLVTKGLYKRGSLLAGNPAKIIRENVTWGK